MDLEKWIELPQTIILPWLLRFDEKFEYPFLYVFLYSVTCLPITSFNNFVTTIHVQIYPCLISEGTQNCSSFWPALQQNLCSENMLPNINTCENGWSKFSANLWVVAIKLFELTQFASQTLPIFFKFELCSGPLWWKHFKTNRRAEYNSREVYDWCSSLVTIVHKY